MPFVENVFPSLLNFLEAENNIALVTLINVEGSSPRPAGSQIGVSSDGRSVGMITGGCAEKAIVAEAFNCINNKENKLVRYGAGSPYLDVTLPCGASIDVYIETHNAEAIARKVASRNAARLSAFTQIDTSAMISTVHETHAGQSPAGRFIKECEPDYRIIVFGEGANLIALSTIAKCAGYDVTAFSPDADALAFLDRAGVSTKHIYREASFNDLNLDRYTAVVTLFHEHEWETPILHAALNSQADYIGALGSKKTHLLRLEALAALPAPPRLLSDIRGPVGLDIGASNPNEIAVSILGQITQHRRRGGQ